MWELYPRASSPTFCLFCFVSRRQHEVDEIFCENKIHSISIWDWRTRKTPLEAATKRTIENFYFDDKKVVISLENKQFSLKIAAMKLRVEVSHFLPRLSDEAPTIEWNQLIDAISGFVLCLSHLQSNVIRVNLYVLMTIEELNCGIFLLACSINCVDARRKITLCWN